MEYIIQNGNRANSTIIILDRNYKMRWSIYTE